MYSTSTSSPTRNSRNWRKSNPKNEGHTFKAWCGGEYIFHLGEDGKLHTRPDHYAQFMVDWKNLKY